VQSLSDSLLIGVSLITIHDDLSDIGRIAKKCDPTFAKKIALYYSRQTFWDWLNAGKIRGAYLCFTLRLCD